MFPHFVLSQIIGILGVTSKNPLWIIRILQVYRAITMVLFVTILPPLGLTLIAFLAPFKDADYDNFRTRYCNHSLAYRSLPQCPESEPNYREFIDGKEDPHGGYFFDGAPCHPFKHVG